MPPPEKLDASVQVKPVPVPPAALNCTLPRGATPASGGAMLTPAETLTLALPLFPSESVTATTSVTPPVAPAVYAPSCVTWPPDALANDQVNPAPLPPAALKVKLPRGVVLALAGET